MNLQLSDQRIRATCRELLKKHKTLSGRRLCEELRARFGAVGKTERVFGIWREECGAGRTVKPGGEVALLKIRLMAAETAAAENLKRAELAELREQAHQDHWAMEVDRLRREVATLRGPGRILPV